MNDKRYLYSVIALIFGIIAILGIRFVLQPAIEDQNDVSVADLCEDPSGENCVGGDPACLSDTRCAGKSNGESIGCQDGQNGFECKCVAIGAPSGCANTSKLVVNCGTQSSACTPSGSGGGNQDTNPAPGAGGGGGTVAGCSGPDNNVIACSGRSPGEAGNGGADCTCQRTQGDACGCFDNSGVTVYNTLPHPYSNCDGDPNNLFCLK